MDNEEVFGPKFLEIFEKMNQLLAEKEKFDSSKQNLLNEIEKAKQKLKVLRSNPIPKPQGNLELEKKEKELFLCLKAFKEENEGLEALKKTIMGLQQRKMELENEMDLLKKNMEEMTKTQAGIEKEINLLDNQLVNTQREIEVNGIKYQELVEKCKSGGQMLNLKKIEIENLLQKFNEIKKGKKVNRALLKNQENALENSFKTLSNKIEESATLLSSFAEVNNNNEKLQTISRKYMEKVNENNRIREENESLKEKINTASIKNFQSKLNNFSPAKKKPKDNNNTTVDTEKCENVRLNLDKVKRLIVDINILQNKKWA